jgi:hypothetical protein
MAGKLGGLRPDCIKLTRFVRFVKALGVNQAAIVAFHVILFRLKLSPLLLRRRDAAMKLAGYDLLPSAPTNQK